MQKGFSLLEILIAIGITAGMTVLIAQSFITTSKGNIKTELKNSIKQSGDFALQNMERSIRSSEAIVSVCDGTPTTSIKIRNSDFGETTYGCILDESLGITRIASSSANPNDPENPFISYISPTTVTLGGDNCTQNMSLLFICTAIPGLPEEVTVQFQLSQPGAPVSTFEQASVPFKMTVARRD